MWDRECQQDNRHADQHQETKDDFAGRDGVGQPGIATVPPPHVAEDEGNLCYPDGVWLGDEDAGQLRDGETNTRSKNSTMLQIRPVPRP
jgi:hypothetical protein